MSDFLSKLKGIFIVQTPSDGQTAEATPAKTDVNAKPAVTTTKTEVVTPAGKVSDKFYEILFGAMETNNQPGFDYLEYKKSLQTLAKMPMDEATRYSSAYAAAQAMGVSSQQLNDSAQFYLNVLKTEDSKFQESVNAQRQKQIGSKEKAIADLDATIKAKGEQIARLTQEIAAHQEDMGKMKAEISEAVVKIETTLSDFHATYSDLIGQIG
ncbi:MAG: hypothetical protein ACOVO2_21800, partial [Emticicia sp.]|uniref:hypothetical protein n=1 Tax=Emticicia sp. TaxID=1930953 RepID=UPI003BA5469F